MLKKLYFIFLLLPFLVGAQNYPAKPSNYVTDETGTLTQEQQNTLNAKLKVFEDTTTNQIFVYVAKSLNGSDLAQLSEEIFHNWKIGQKDKNNGVLIAIFIDDHKFRIQTGYGLEGALPDLLTKRIQDNDMRPLFKQGDYFGGINAGIDLLAYYSCHEFNPDLIKDQAPEVVDYGKGTSGVLIGYGINLVLFLVLCLVLYGKSAKQRSSTATTIWLVIGIVLALIPCLGGIIIFVMCGLLANLKGGGGFSSSSSSWSSSDSSSSWSSSSSDFGGGGGGDSGGGGSSSDW